MHARRRLLVLGAAALAAPLGALAQSSGRVLRVAILEDGSEEGTRRLWQVFLRRLEQLGYAQGRNLRIEARYARGATERLAALAAELVNLKPDVIVSSSTSAARGAKQATSRVPIVFIESADPVGAGLVASLGRPGGNATGLSPMQTEMATKWIELLREFAPMAKRLAFLADSENQGSLAIFNRLQDQGRILGATFRMLDGRQREGLERSFDLVVQERIDGLIVGGTPVLLDHREQILQFVARRKLPTIYIRREYVDAGGLLFYGTDRVPMYARAADYVHKIVQGAKPADLPVEQPYAIRMVVNLKTAQALGINIPKSLLVRADEVIE